MEYNVKKISKNIKIKKIRKNLIYSIIFTIIIFLFIINAMGLYKNITQEEEYTDIAGLYFFNIISGSMDPVIKKNDLVIVKKINYKELKENDIITFKQEDTVITHRIIKIIKMEDEFFYKTKGDNNEIEDNFEVIPNQIYGKNIYSINNIGGLVDYIHTVNGLMNIIIIIFLIFFIISLNEKRKSKRKNKRKKYEIKKLRENYSIKLF